MNVNESAFVGTKSRFLPLRNGTAYYSLSQGFPTGMNSRHTNAIHKTKRRIPYIDLEKKTSKKGSSDQK